MLGSIWPLLLILLTLCGLWLLVVALPIALLSVCEPLRAFVYGQPLLLAIYMNVCFWPFCATRRTMLRWTRKVLARRPTYLYIDCGKNESNAVLVSAKELPPADDSGMVVRCIAVSDTHGFHRDLPSLPKADVLFFSGNLLLDSHGADKQAVDQLAAFDRWLASAAAAIPERVVVAGSHDGACQELGPEKMQQLLPHALYIEDRHQTLDCGLVVFGSPRSVAQSAEPYNHAFQGPLHTDLPDAVLGTIPDGIDVLVTHGPPGPPDISLDGHVGSQALYKKVKEVRPSAHIFGHVPGAFGIGMLDHVSNDRVVFANCISTDAWYAVVNPPIVFDIPFRKVD